MMLEVSYGDFAHNATRGAPVAKNGNMEAEAP
jgi:hypothetical protein